MGRGGTFLASFGGMQSRLLSARWLCLLLLLLPGILRAAGGPVSVAELDFWLRGGRTSGEILVEVNRRGLLEPVDAEAQRRLRGNGADAALLARLADNSLVVNADAAAQARQEAALLAEKDRANRALALQQLRGGTPGNGGDSSPAATGRKPEGAAGSSNTTPTMEVAAFPEPSGVVGAADGWRVGYVNACRLARTEHKMVLILFTGSDWSDACQRVDQVVFGDAAFKAYAAQKLVLMRADFPRRTIQSKDVQEQNLKLAEAFGVKTYPSVYLLNEQARPVAKLTSDLSTPQAFLAKLRLIEAKMQPAQP